MEAGRMVLIRSKENPIITREKIPDKDPALKDVSSVFNPGAVRFNDSFLLLLRVQNRGRETYILVAESPNGVRFKVRETPVRFQGIEKVKEKIHHCYDPRITCLDGVYYIMFAMDMEKECRLGLAKTENFSSFDFMGIVSCDDNRNGVLFPEKVGGRYLRLDRPNRKSAGSGDPASGSAICLSESDDLLNWKEIKTVIQGCPHYWDELIGAGPPPIKTKEGWLQIYHGVATHFASANIYQAGVLLLDLDDPGTVLARGCYNILEPREPYELMGQVPNVVFPSGAVAEKTDDAGFAAPESKIFVYYGAADTSVCLAVSTVSELIEDAHK
jgi:predicted GH43/DUF377 family glycosyl hydrolase